MRLSFTIYGNDASHLVATARERAAQFFGSQPHHFTKFDAVPGHTQAGGSVVMWLARVEAEDGRPSFKPAIPFEEPG